MLAVPGAGGALQARHRRLRRAPQDAPGSGPGAEAGRLAAFVGAVARTAERGHNTRGRLLEPASGGGADQATAASRNTVQARQAPEMEVRWALHRIQADLGEALTIRPKGEELAVRGTLDGAARRDEIVAALATLPRASVEVVAAEPGTDAPAGARPVDPGTPAMGRSAAPLLALRLSEDLPAGVRRSLLGLVATHEEAVRSAAREASTLWKPCVQSTAAPRAGAGRGRTRRGRFSTSFGGGDVGRDHAAGVRVGALHAEPGAVRLSIPSRQSQAAPHAVGPRGRGPGAASWGARAAARGGIRAQGQDRYLLASSKSAVCLKPCQRSDVRVNKSWMHAR